MQRQSTKTKRSAALASSSILYRTAFTGVALSLIAGTNAQANPIGGQVESGIVNITQPSAGNMVIYQGSDRAIINWQSFNILHGESTRFVQPSSSSIALNRIHDGNPTQILGSLSANGRIVLVNPNGVFFGAGSRVDVAGLVATTADISSANFNAGIMKFDRAGAANASIVNKGTITAAEGGLVALVAPGVRNDGVIQANLGTVTMASGQTVAIDMYGDNLYSFAVDKKTVATPRDENGNAMDSAVENNGIIRAHGGTVMLTANAARDVVTNAVNNRGVIEASAARMEGGTIILDGGSHGRVQVAGKLDASGKGAGQKGGKVTITGESVELAGANIDASGSIGGGTVLIGGDYQGGGTLAHAGTVTADASTIINVSAIDQGNAGTAVLWSDDATSFSGTLLGTGGALGGNGGLVEVSSENTLFYDGFTQVQAAAGNAGTLLLDPLNIIVGPVLAAATEFVLNLGGNVTIFTPNFGSQAGNITVNSGINWFGNGSLTLTAINNIIINSTIRSTILSTNHALGAITLNAGNNVLINGASLRTASGAITVNGNQVSLISGLIRSFSGNIVVNNSGRFFSDTANAIYNDASTDASVSVRQSSDGRIQNAVDAIGTTGSGGGKVTLGAGSWNEQVRIDQSNFTLTGQGAGISIITPPRGLDNTYNNGVDNKAIIGVVNADDVTISNLTVDGLNNGGNNYRFVGIGYFNSGGLISGTTVTNISDNPASGMQHGNAIYGYVDSGDHTLEIADNTINNFQKGGIVLNGSGLGGYTFTANVHDNTITGLGAIGFIAQNGIQFGFGTQGSIIDNTISAIGYTDPASWLATGILLYEAGDGVEIAGNTITGTGVDAGIYAYGSDGVNIHDNTVTGSLDGIIVHDLDGAIVHKNTVSDVNGIGISLYDATTSTVTDNTVHDTGSYGIFADASGGTEEKYTKINGNLIYNTGDHAINVLGSDYTRINGNYIGVVNKRGRSGDENNINGDGIAVEGSRHIEIKSNRITETAALPETERGSGIRVASSYDVTIGGEGERDGNYITNAGWDGIKLDGGIGFEILNNRIKNTERVGIYGAGITDVNIEGNRTAFNNSNATGFGAISLVGGSGDVTIHDNTISDVVNGSGIMVNSLTGKNAITSNVIYNTQSHGIEVLYTPGIDISGNYIGFKDKVGTRGDEDNIGADGIRVDWSNSAVIAGNHITETAATPALELGSGIRVNDSHYVTIGGDTEEDGNIISNIGWDGIKIGGGSGFTISHNNIDNTERVGIYAAGFSDSTISRNLITRTMNNAEGFGGISIDGGSSDLRILRNEIYNVANGSGIRLNSVTGTNTVRGNRIDSVEQDGIEALNTTNLTVQNNRIRNAERDGIHLESVSNANVIHNRIHDADRYGIYGQNLYVTSFGLPGLPGDMIRPMIGYGNFGQSNISYNHIGDIGITGIYLDGIENANVVGNYIHDVGALVNPPITENTARDELRPTLPLGQGHGIYVNNATVRENGWIAIPFTAEQMIEPIGSAGYQQSVISGNRIKNIANDGIHVTNVQNANISGNRVHSVGNDGIYANSLTTTSNNWMFPTMMAEGWWPVFGDSTRQSIIHDNHVYFTGHDGIHVRNVENAKITFNNVHDLANDGIYASNLLINGMPYNQYEESPFSPAGKSKKPLLGDHYGQSVISFNHVRRVGHDGIHVEGAANAYITDNRVHSLGNDGIFASNLYVSGGLGYGYARPIYAYPGDASERQSQILRNHVFYTGHDGIHLEMVENAHVAKNRVHDLANDGIYAYNLYVSGLPMEYVQFEGNDSIPGGDDSIPGGSFDPAQSIIAYNTVYGVGHDGIHLEVIENAYVHDNRIRNVGNDGIYARNPAPFILPPIEEGSEGEVFEKKIKREKYITGGGSFSNARFEDNRVRNAGHDGIHLDDMDSANVSGNRIRNVGNAGIAINSSDDATVSGNRVENSPFGMLFTDSQRATITGNLDIIGNGIGIELNRSSDALLSGNVFTGNALGINLDNSLRTRLDTETFNSANDAAAELAAVGLRIANGSSGTIVKDSAFNDMGISILIDGEGSNMAFEGDGSTFDTNGFFFVLANGAMNGEPDLDASQQTFNGTRGSEFTQLQLQDAEFLRTTDLEDGFTVGNVFYKEFEPSEGVDFDQSVLDEFQQQRRGLYRRGLFSYAGRVFNLNTDPVDPGAFDLGNINLSLLNQAAPTTATGIANLFANLAPAAGGNDAASLANLAPSAGGPATPQQFAGLAPAAGGAAGDGSCGNSFLGNGYSTSFSCAQ